MLLVLRQLDTVRADQATLKIMTELAKREGRDNDKEIRQALHRFTVNYGQQLGPAEVERLAALADERAVHWYQLRKELLLAKAGLTAVPA